MRLLHLDANGTLSLTEFLDNIPPYAILSHTWRPDGGEVVFRDIAGGTSRNKAGYNKIAFCAETAASHGLKYFWVDTCCIDKSSSAELQEAINSMFAWYHGASRCYVYLADVSAGDYDLSNHSSQLSLEAAFQKSRWFKRGWTLQELLAPSSVEFFSQDGKKLGDKKSLEHQIHEITKIPVSALQGVPLWQFSIDERFSWAHERETSRKEDWAYSLLGIFDIFIPLLYGEGRENAVIRLIREVGKASRGAGPGASTVTPRELISTSCANPREPKSDTTGASSREVRTFDSVRSWVYSLQTQRSEPVDTVPEASFAARFSKFRQNLRSKDVPDTLSDLNLMNPGSPRSGPATSSWSPLARRRQQIPPELHHLVKRSIRDDQIHLIIQGLGDSGSEIRDQIFPRAATVDAVHEYLDKEGFGLICGFRVHTCEGAHYDVARRVPQASVIPVEVTDGPSCYTIQEGYRIKQNEKLIDFYNMRFARRTRIKVIAHLDYLEVVDDHSGSNVYVDFKRTIRVPRDDRTYELPPPQASFPLLLARHFSSTLPEWMQRKDGVFFPMLQREAFMLAFSSSKDMQRQFAIRVYTGTVNALTGEPALEGSSSEYPVQDYVLAPEQGLLSGYRVGNSTKQFVAMPMGEKYTVEHQITGEEFIGGIQLEITPRLRESVTFWKSTLWTAAQSHDESTGFDPYATPRDLGLSLGQRIMMQDRNPSSLYDKWGDDIGPTEGLVEPASFYSKTEKTHRPTLVRELFDGPSYMNFDLSSSLVLSAIKPIRMLFDFGANMITFECSPLARIRDLYDFISARMRARGMRPYVKMMLIIAGETYPEDADSSIGDLNLSSPQRIGIKTSINRDVAGLEYQEQKPEVRITPGWDMGVAMGGQIKQTIVEDDYPRVWDWKATRSINIQVINAVAFHAVTGLAPPLSPLFLTYPVTKSIPGTPEPAHIRSSVQELEPLSSVKTINDLDCERGAAVSMTLCGDKIAICVCCESNICDSLLNQARLDPCGHMFCRVCIACFMTENQCAKCAYCFTTAARVVQLSAQEQAPQKSKFSLDMDVEEFKINSYAIETDSSVHRALITLDECRAGNATAREIEYAIGKGQGGGLVANTAELQLLLGQMTSKPDAVSELPIGQLVRCALSRNNRDAWRMLAPLYKLSNHQGLLFAQQSKLDALEVIEEFGSFGDVNLNSAAQRLGPLKAQLLIKLGIFDLDLSRGHLVHLVARGITAELKLLLSLGGDPVLAESDGEIALHRTTDAKVAEVLCEAGAPIAALDGDKNTTIEKAAAYGRKGVLEVLLRQDGAREILDHRNKYGKAAVHYTNNRPEIFKLLIEAGANPDLEISLTT